MAAARSHMILAAFLLGCMEAWAYAPEAANHNMQAAQLSDPNPFDKYIFFYRGGHHCCFGFNHLSSNFECEARYAEYLGRTLVIEDVCESFHHDGVNHGEERQHWATFYDLGRIQKLVKLVHQDTFLPSRSAASTEDLFGQQNVTVVVSNYGSLFDDVTRNNAAGLIIVDNSHQPFCNWYQACDNRELEMRVGEQLYKNFHYSTPIKAHARSIISDLGQYNSMHIRRGDKLADQNLPSELRVDDLSPDQVLNNAAPWLSSGTTLYVATDETNADYLRPLESKFALKRASNYDHILFDLKHSPFSILAVEMLVLAHGKRFIMSDNTHVSRRVQILRYSVPFVENELYYHLQSGKTTHPHASNWCKYCLWHWELAVFNGKEKDTIHAIQLSNASESSLMLSLAQLDSPTSIMD